MEQVRAATPESFRKAFPGREIQEVIDAHEIECEASSNTVVNKTMHSEYKHGQRCETCCCRPAKLRAACLHY